MGSRDRLKLSGIGIGILIIFTVGSMVIPVGAMEWSMPQTISDFADHGQGIGPSIAIDNQSNWHIAFSRYYTDDSMNGSFNRIMYYNSTGFNEIAIESFWPSEMLPDMPPWNPVSDPDMAIGPDGSIYIAYQGESCNVQYIVRGPDGLWSSPQTIPDSGYSEEGCPFGIGPSIAVDNQSNWHIAVHKLYSDANVSGYFNRIMYYNSTGFNETAIESFWPSEMLPDMPPWNPASDPDMAIGPDGSVYIAYTGENCNVQYIVKGPDGLWSSPQTIPDSGYSEEGCPQGEGPSIAVDETGVWHIATNYYNDLDLDGEEDGANLAYYNSTGYSEIVSHVEPFYIYDNRLADPEIATGPDGSIYIVYKGVEGFVQYVKTPVSPSDIILPPHLFALFYGTPTSGTVPLTVQFTDVSIGDITSYAWGFGDGSTSTEQNPSHVYTTKGTYTVNLTVTGITGSDDNIKTRYVRTSNPPAVANFSANVTSGTIPLIVQFTDRSTGYITGYYWNFGDGETSNEQNPTHQYTAAGTYTIKLTVRGENDRQNTKIMTDYISVSTDVELIPDFEASPMSGPDPLDVQFKDASTGDITTWEWTFGDGGTSTEQNPLHTYENPGTYTVSLKVSRHYAGTEEKSVADYITVTSPSTLDVKVWTGGRFIEPSNGEIWADQAFVPVHVQVLKGGQPYSGATLITTDEPMGHEWPGKTDENGLLEIKYPLNNIPPELGSLTVTVIAKGDGITGESEPIKIVDFIVKSYPKNVNTAIKEQWDAMRDQKYWEYMTKPSIDIPFPRQFGYLAFLPSLAQTFAYWFQQVGYKPEVGDIILVETFEYSSQDTTPVYRIREKVIRDGWAIENKNSYTEDKFTYQYVMLRPVLTLDGFKIVLASPAVPYITAPDGSHAGYDPQTGSLVGEFPMAIGEPGDEPFKMFILNPQQGNYVINIIGTGTGPYTISIESINSDGIPSQPISFTGQTTIGKIDGFTLKVIKSGDITVNRPPQLTNPGDQTTIEGKTLSLNLAATDPDSDLLTYTFTPTLAGASISGNTFTWTPGTAGKYPVKFNVTDTGGLSDEEGINITVTAPIQNTPPVLTNPGDKSVNEGSVLQITLAASDKEGGLLTYSFTSTKTLPGASISGNIFTWTPSSGTAGTYPVKFKVTDIGSLSDEETINITVNAPTTNVPTNVKIVPKSINLGIKGYFLAFVTLPEAYKGATIDMNTVSCSGAPAVRMMKLKLFPRIVGFVFKTSDLKGVGVGNKVSLTLKGELKNTGKLYTFSGSDSVKVISKPTWQPDDIKDISKDSDDQLFKKFNK